MYLLEKEKSIYKGITSSIYYIKNTKAAKCSLTFMNEEGRIKFAGDIVVSWKAALRVADLWLRRGRFISFYQENKNIYMLHAHYQCHNHVFQSNG